MNEEYKTNLLEISKQVQAVGRKIGSTKVDAEGLKDLSSALQNHARSVEIYARLIEA